MRCLFLSAEHRKLTVLTEQRLFPSEKEAPANMRFELVSHYWDGFDLMRSGSN